MDIHLLKSFKMSAAKRWAAVCLAAFYIALISACTDNATVIEKSNEPKELYGNYRFEEQIYINPLSSFNATEDLQEYYTFTETSIIITNEAGKQELPVSYEREKVDEEAFKDSFLIEIGVPKSSQYKERYQYTLTAPSVSPAYRLYLMDEEIWLAKVQSDRANSQKSEYIWSIYKIVKLDAKNPGKASIAGTTDSVDAFLVLNKDFKSGYDDDACYNITPEYMKQNPDYKVFKCVKSAASFLLYDNIVYPLGEWIGGMGVTSLALADLNRDDEPEMYFTYSFGSGIHRSHAAYFDPATKQVVNLDYMHLNKDMLVVNNNDGSLSLFDAQLTNMSDFANFDIEGSEFITRIVNEDGKITLNNG